MAGMGQGSRPIATPTFGAIAASPLSRPVSAIPLSGVWALFRAVIGNKCWIADIDDLSEDVKMDDQSALVLALDVARAFKDGERSPLDTARMLTGIVNPWRSWWTELGGASGPLSALYAADEAAMKLHWLGDEAERWHSDVRESKQMEL